MTTLNIRFYRRRAPLGLGELVFRGSPVNIFTGYCRSSDFAEQRLTPGVASPARISGHTFATRACNNPQNFRLSPPPPHGLPKIRRFPSHRVTPFRQLAGQLLAQENPRNYMHRVSLMTPCPGLRRYIVKPWNMRWEYALLVVTSRYETPGANVS